jgi:hypothetical protein
MRPFVMALVLVTAASAIFAAPAHAQQAPAPAAPPTRMFNGDAGLILMYVKPDKTAEAVQGRSRSSRSSLCVYREPVGEECRLFTWSDSERGPSAGSQRHLQVVRGLTLDAASSRDSSGPGQRFFQIRFADVARASRGHPALCSALRTFFRTPGSVLRKSAAPWSAAGGPAD